LDLWHRAVADIPREQILPIGLGNAVERANVAAFFGNQRLQLEIAQILRQKNSSHWGVPSIPSDTAAAVTASSFSLGDVTALQSLAMSHPLLAQCLPQVLPQHLDAEWMEERIPQENSQMMMHDAGTILKAAVDAVATTHDLADAALAALASYLVDQALAVRKGAATDLGAPAPQDDDGETAAASNHTPTAGSMINPKGQLLQAGGTITVSRREDSPDHAPLFTATAHFENLTGTVQYGHSKKEAEQAAAAMLWRYYTKVLSQKDMTCSARPSAVYDEEMENARGRLLSIGGVVTSEILPEYPPHMPRFRAACRKTFLVKRPTADDDDDATSSYAIAATAEGRTHYEAERIACTIVWHQVLNMPTSGPHTTLLLAQDTQFDPHDPDDDVPEVVAPKRSAKQRRIERNLKKFAPKKISQYQVRDSQRNFLQYELAEQPTLVLRPGGETVIESWYRGALHPQAAFHRALLAPHVFPQLVATVNAYTRHNLLAAPLDDTETLSADESAAVSTEDERNRTRSPTAPVENENRSDMNGTAWATADENDGTRYTEEAEGTGEEPRDMAAAGRNGPEEDEDDQDWKGTDVVIAAGHEGRDDPSDRDEITVRANIMSETNLVDDTTTTFFARDSSATATTEDEGGMAPNDSDQDVVAAAVKEAMANHGSDGGQWQQVSLQKEATANPDGGDDQWEFVSAKTSVRLDRDDAPGEPGSDRNDRFSPADQNDPGESPAKEEPPQEQKKKSTAMKTYTVLIVVMPSLKHPLVKALGKDYNSTDVLAKCFIEHGRTPREARTAAGLAVNRYLIDVLLKDYDYLLEEVPGTSQPKDSHFHTMSRLERKNMFFEF
jgi:Double-stranded RNA binding motif